MQRRAQQHPLDAALPQDAALDELAVAVAYGVQMQIIESKAGVDPLSVAHLRAPRIAMVA